MSRRTPHLVLAVTAAVLLLTGCGSEDVTVKTPDGKVEVDRDGEEVTFQSEDGEVKVGSSLADDFPSDVPLVDGEVITSASSSTSGSQGFTAMIQAEGSFDEVADDAFGKLDGAGFEQLSNTTVPEMAMRGYQNAAWTVSVQVIKADDGVTVNYTVAPATED